MLRPVLGLADARRVEGAREALIERLWHAVPCYPTISEVWLRLLEGYRDADVSAARPERERA